MTHLWLLVAEVKDYRSEVIMWCKHLLLLNAITLIMLLVDHLHQQVWWPGPVSLRMPVHWVHGSYMPNRCILLGALTHPVPNPGSHACWGYWSLAGGSPLGPLCNLSQLTADAAAWPVEPCGDSYPSVKGPSNPISAHDPEQQSTHHLADLILKNRALC